MMSAHVPSRCLCETPPDQYPAKQADLQFSPLLDLSADDWYLRESREDRVGLVIAGTQILFLVSIPSIFWRNIAGYVLPTDVNA